jgi:two-component system, NarL family, nitrate/nitrite response regulator NarL
MLAITPASESAINSDDCDDRLPIAAVLVGGDILLREGLKRFLSDGEVTIAGELDSAALASNGHGFGDDVELVILLDHTGQGEALLGELATLKARWPGARAMVIAGEARISLLARAIEAGADGYLCKDVSPEALIQSIKLVVMGLNVFPIKMVSDLLQASQSENSRREAARVPSLTGRERDILSGLLSGLSNKAISTHLGISEATVKAQLRHLLRKLSVENRTQAALWAVEQNIVRTNEAA